MTTAPESFDVAVVGAGPAGAAAAVALRRRGASVVVLESRPGAAWRVGETLPPAARPLLHALGVLAELEADGHLPSHGNCSAWGTEALVATDFVFGPDGNGWQLDRERFDARLAEAARRGGADIRYGSRLAGARRAAGRWELAVESADRCRDIRASWLVDATGRRSAVARRLGARRDVADSLVCVYGMAAPSPGCNRPDVDARTLVEAVPTGWWYTALVPGGRRTVAWLTDADVIRRLPWRGTAWFALQVRETHHLGPLLARHGYEFVGSPKCSVANSSRTAPWYGNGWLAVGDAAIAFDPLSSQGLINALYTGLRGADAVAEVLAGDSVAVTRYAEVLAAVWDAYLKNLREYYRLERRWGDRPFWYRRQ